MSADRPGSDHAFPHVEIANDCIRLAGGLTKREMFAKAAMAAFIANGDNTMFLQAPTDRPLTESVAEAACDYADALLAQLSKAPQP